MAYDDGPMPQSMTAQVRAAEMSGKPLFDVMRSEVEGAPGMQRSISTIKSVLPWIRTSATHVIETVRTEEGFYGFIEMMSANGQERVFLPPAVMNALYRQHDTISKRLRSERGRRAAATAAAKGIVPFQRREDREEGDDEPDGES